MDKRQRKMAKSSIADAFNKYRHQLLSFIGIRTSGVDAEDVLQDVFLRLVETDNDSPVTQTASWLYKVARNKIIDNSRKHRERPMALAEGNEASDNFIRCIGELMASDDYSPEREQLRKAVWAEVDDALNELPREQRYVFEQTEFAGRSFKELSLETGKPIGTLISRKHYAVMFLRNRLREVYNELVMDS